MSPDIKSEFQELKQNTASLMTEYEETIVSYKVLASLLLTANFPLFIFFIASLSTGHYDPKYLDYFIYAIAGTVTTTITYFILNKRRLIRNG